MNKFQRDTMASEPAAKIDKTQNSINILHPYRTQYRTWVYDDPDVPVYGEAFVMGSSEVIDILVGQECNSFKMLISCKPIPKHTAKIIRIKEQEEIDGIKGWYQLEGTSMKHWLCGQVLAYFPDYPEEIYIKIEKPSKEQETEL